MATWKLDNVVLTDIGRGVLSKAEAGEGLITIHSVVAGSNRVPPEDLHLQESIRDIQQTLDVIGIEYVENGSVLNLQLSNEKVVDSYTLNQIGIYATHPSIRGTFLYVIAQCEADGKADTIPVYSDTPAILKYNIYLLNSSESVIRFTPPTSGYVTRTEFDKHIKDFNNPHKIYFTQLVDSEEWASKINGAASKEEVDKIKEDIKNLEDKITSDIIDNPFLITYEDLEGLSVTGIWDKENAKLKC